MPGPDVSLVVLVVGMERAFLLSGRDRSTLRRSTAVHSNKTRKYSTAQMRDPEIIHEERAYPPATPRNSADMPAPSIVLSRKRPRWPNGLDPLRLRLGACEGASSDCSCHRPFGKPQPSAYSYHVPRPTDLAPAGQQRTRRNLSHMNGIDVSRRSSYSVLDLIRRRTGHRDHDHRICSNIDHRPEGWT